MAGTCSSMVVLWVGLSIAATSIPEGQTPAFGSLEFHQVRSNVAPANNSATVAFEFDGRTYHYDLSAFSMFSDDAIAVQHTNKGEVPLAKDVMNAFRGVNYGRKAAALLFENGAVSGLFEVDGGALVELKPSFQADQAEVGGLNLHQIVLFQTIDPFTRRRLSEAETEKGSTNGSVHFHAFEVAPELAFDPVDLASSIKDQEVLQRKTPKKPSEGGIIKWYGDCYAGDSSMHQLKVGIIVDKSAYDRHGAATPYVIAEVLAKTSFIYEQQLNVQVKADYVKIYSSSVGAPNYASQCPDVKPLATKLSWLREAVLDSQIPFSGATHVFTDCPKPDAGGYAYVSGVCHTGYGINIGINLMRDVSTAFGVFRHELGHNFGGNHHTMGGLMGGNTGVNGILQFHESQKTSICQTISRVVNNCQGKFRKCEGSCQPADGDLLSGTALIAPGRFAAVAFAFILVMRQRL